LYISSFMFVASTLPSLNTEMVTFCDGFLTKPVVYSNPRLVIFTSSTGGRGGRGSGGIGGFGGSSIPGLGFASVGHDINTKAQIKSNINTINILHFIFSSYHLFRVIPQLF